MFDEAGPVIALMVAILLFLLLAAMTAGVWTWTHRHWHPRHVPILAVLAVGLLGVVNLAYGDIAVGLPLAATACLWTTWIAGIGLPSLRRLSTWRRRRAQKTHVPKPVPAISSSPIIRLRRTPRS